MDRDFGLIHVKLQTWLPMQVQVYVNGHEWLARSLSSSHIAFKKQDNIFVWIDEPERVQKWADRFAGLDWPAILERYARRVNSLLHTLLAGYPRYWVTAQSEYSTDILFNSSSDLRELFPRLLSHSTRCSGAGEVMSFLGRKLHGKFLGEVVSDLKPGSRSGRLPGARVKHRVKENWLEMYDQAGSVLRVEMVIHSAQEFKVRKTVPRNRRKVMQGVPMRKGVAYLFRYREVSRQANSRYLDALAVVDDPSPAIEQLDEVTARNETASGSGVRAFNPLSCDDTHLFRAMMPGEHCVRGLSNADLRARLAESPVLRPFQDDAKCRSAKVSRILGRFYAHRLIAKIPRTRRWRVTNRGRRVTAASLRLRDFAYPPAYANTTAA